ncbi:neuronal acetylcholine receptor subunit non-alpha-3-like [Mercenaria mercenaria]|uniref:neuronal acetylcholine receptor subunit non-alpha-3-like n=1 Tax=Mercenaria mercenaria TaxID=6596 RepID=UPI00234F93A7|nr:neuronal acetylcholine receptor subunit non-alpha-3-like [Mercenaria mercenaria]
MASILACCRLFLTAAFLSDIFVNAVVTSLSDIDDEITTLFDGYFEKQAIVPLQTVGSTMAVTVDFDLVSIVDFDDDSGSTTVAGYLTVTWTEERYTTIADDVDVTVQTSAIWTPPLLILNSMSSGAVIGSNDDIAKFNLNTAQVIWKTWIHTKVTCDSSSFFPFDQHECSLKISSLSLDNTEMTITAADDTIGTASFVEKSQWKLKTTSVASYIVASYPYVEYKLTIQRKSQYLTLIIICPVITISLVHLFVFFIPQRQSNERSNYSIVSVIGVLVTLLWAMTYIPLNASPVSIIVYYLLTEFLINVAVMIVAVTLTDKFQGRKCCTNSMFFGNLVPERKSEKVSNKDDLSIRSEPGHDIATAREVRVSSVATAWENDVFDEQPNTQDKSSEEQGDAKVNHARASVAVFLVFLCLHFCFTIAFFVPLGLNVE